MLLSSWVDSVAAGMDHARVFALARFDQDLSIQTKGNPNTILNYIVAHIIVKGGSDHRQRFAVNPIPH